VTQYRSVVVQLTGTWSGTVTWQGSADCVTYVPIIGISTGALTGPGSLTATTNDLYYIPLNTTCFQAVLTTATSGTVNGKAFFFPGPGGSLTQSSNVNPECAGTVTSFDVAGGTTGLTFTGGPITSSGTITATGTAMAIGGTVVDATPFAVLSVDGSGNLQNFLLPAVDLTGQTAAITATTMYTTVTAGLYRVSYVAKVTTVAGTSSTLGGFQVTYTDATDSVVTTTVAGTTSTLNTTQAQVSGVVVVYASAATAIQYLMGYASNSAAQMTYTLHIKVEAL